MPCVSKGQTSLYLNHVKIIMPGRYVAHKTHCGKIIISCLNVQDGECLHEELTAKHVQSETRANKERWAVLSYFVSRFTVVKQPQQPSAYED